MKKLIAVAIVALILTSGCASQRYNRPHEAVHTVTGAAIGGAIGSLIGGGSGQIIATAVGAVIGGFIGNENGKVLDGNGNGTVVGSQYPSYYGLEQNAGTEAAYARGRADRVRAAQRQAEIDAYQRGRRGQ